MPYRPVRSSPRMISVRARTVVAAIALLVAAGSGSPLIAQTTHIVGPGGFYQIGPAIRASSPGDTILITASRRYEHFTLDRGVTIRAGAGVRALVSNSILAAPTSGTTIRVPPGQTGELIGLLFAPEIPFLGHRAIGRVRVTGRGAVVFRSCWIEGQTDGCGAGWPALEVQDAAVALQLCRLRGYDRGGIALLARRSTVSAFDSTFRGGDGCWDSYAHASDAIRLEASVLHGSRLWVTGGSTPFLNPNYDAGHGIVIDPGSRLWLAHAVVNGGSGGIVAGRGGDGIHNLSATPVEAIRWTATGGAGAPPGVPVVGPVSTNPALVVAWASPVGPRLGATWTMHFQLVPQTSIVAWIGTHSTPAVAQWLAQPLWLAAHPAPIGWAMRVADAQGDADVPIAIPNLPALRGVPLWSQGSVAALGSRIQLTPLLGGRVW